MAPSSKILKTNFADGIYKAWRCIHAIDPMELATTVLNEYVSSFQANFFDSLDAICGEAGAKDINAASPDCSKVCQYAVSVRL
jgi:hypothetical protein